MVPFLPEDGKPHWGIIEDKIKNWSPILFETALDSIATIDIFDEIIAHTLVRYWSIYKGSGVLSRKPERNVIDPLLGNIG